MEKIQYPTHPVRNILTGPPECGKAVLTNSFLYFSNEFKSFCIY